MPTESNLVRKILKKLDMEYPMGVWYKIHTGPFQERGMPDIVGCLRGRFIAFEVKTPDNKKGVTNYQKLQLSRISSAEGKCTVITSAKEAMKFLGKNFYKIRPKTHLQSPPDMVESTVEGEPDGNKPTKEESPVKKPNKKPREKKTIVNSNKKSD